MNQPTMRIIFFFVFLSMSNHNKNKQRKKKIEVEGKGYARERMRVGEIESGSLLFSFLFCCFSGVKLSTVGEPSLPQVYLSLPSFLLPYFLSIHAFSAMSNMGWCPFACLSHITLSGNRTSKTRVDSQQSGPFFGSNTFHFISFC